MTRLTILKNFPLLAHVNLYQCVKDHSISLICSRDMAHYKILQSDWLRTFWPITQEQKISQIWNLAGTQ